MAPLRPLASPPPATVPAAVTLPLPTPPAGVAHANEQEQGPGAKSPGAVAKFTEPRCSVGAGGQNLLKEPGFEQPSSRWVLENRKNSFRRIDATELRAWENSPALGGKIMMLKPTPRDDDLRDGPPFLTQEFQVPSGTKRIRVCCDLGYTGPITSDANVRLSVTDPNVRYTEGGKTFPFTRVSPLKSKQWRHVEWEVDVSAMGTRRLEVGYMFPFSRSELWYIDNASVTALAP